MSLQAREVDLRNVTVKTLLNELGYDGLEIIDCDNTAVTNVLNYPGLESFTSEYLRSIPVTSTDVKVKTDTFGFDGKLHCIFAKDINTLIFYVNDDAIDDALDPSLDFLALKAMEPYIPLDDLIKSPFYKHLALSCNAPMHAMIKA